MPGARRSSVKSAKTMQPDGVACLFLADENFLLPVTKELRRLNHDIVTLLNLGETDQGRRTGSPPSWTTPGR